MNEHLSQLTEAGLMTVRQDGHQRLFQADRAALDVNVAALVQGTANLPFVQDPYEGRVLHAFLKGGRLTVIPAQRKKRDVILRHLAKVFEPGREYPEREVNTLLGTYHDDFFTLRRELVGAGLLTRSGGVYRRPEESR